MGRASKIVLFVAVTGLVAAPGVAGAISGLSGPVFGMGTAPNGDLLVADASTGVLGLRDDTITSTWSQPGLTDVAPIGRGTAWATATGSNPQEDTGQALYRISEDGAEQVVNLFEFEDTVDPDDPSGTKESDSNPYAVLSEGGRSALVADAGGNVLLRADNRGNVDVLAVFPKETVSTDNAKDLFGCPESGADICGLPEELPAEAVPTSIARGPDGWLYVGELKGFPAPAGESNIWKVAPDADWAECGNSPDCVKVFEGGFTSVIDLVFGPDGTLYVAELDEASWFAVEVTPEGMEGGTINACDVVTLACTEVISGVNILTALAFDGDGTLWATRNALVPDEVDVFPVVE